MAEAGREDTAGGESIHARLVDTPSKGTHQNT
jgi:hypothetical protein